MKKSRNVIVILTDVLLLGIILIPRKSEIKDGGSVIDETNQL